MGQKPVQFDVLFLVLNMLYDKISSVYTDDLGFTRNRQHCPKLPPSPSLVPIQMYPYARLSFLMWAHISGSLSLSWSTLYPAYHGMVF